MSEASSNVGPTEAETLAYFLRNRIVQRGRVDFTRGYGYPPDYDRLDPHDQILYEFGRQYQANGADAYTFAFLWQSMWTEDRAA